MMADKEVTKVCNFMIVWFSFVSFVMGVIVLWFWLLVIASICIACGAGHFVEKFW